MTHKHTACGFEFYTTVNFYDDGRPGEVFIVIAKEGSEVAGFVDGLAVTISIALQYGVPWEVLSEKYLCTRFGNHDDEHSSLLHAFAVVITGIIEGWEKALD